tara:strand:+ start:2697 stop:3125 length:429 start_codon:yes stop_codon:yes gene_type:complete
MSNHFEIKDLRHNRDGFEVRVGYFYEDIHPNELFDDTVYETDKMAKRIDAGYDAWFGFWAKAYLDGHELGYANLGGLYYKDDHAESIIEKKEEHWYEDVIYEAVEQAKKESGSLWKHLGELLSKYPNSIEQVDILKKDYLGQ